MEKEAIKIFGMILDNASNINKEIQLQIYKILDLDGKKLSINENEDIRIKEEIKTSIEKFSFNLQELDFLAQIKEIIEVVKSGNTYYYIKDENDKKYKVSINVNDELPFIKQEDTITIGYYNIKQEIIEIKKLY